ncbi:peptidylprolyl isomerase [Rhodovulum sulfidophilum]|uniref:Parvulin-like PPIase n=1 Tax=Rhodovulum sulfidophilum TaxID=35806 RepID=A0ABS1RMZ2_RHOSU|nr:peptidylprolyl isomerase [Rhodovulum sulfidophilum]ANB33167.1 peptidylprolyl isomerase [Rhodovulum sulfidophilum DSM 1374]ANB37015.1 peptidylprolyl isomerase [Rhodovulum sulfidophilum]MBK5925333.1 peptidylprolyl isomerase [Rhodovulum sulfidophilum]MBL3607288.1 peptidylprolyl isomerase [Rhodovulum sulfidophilum]MCE8420766.1 peptidylprolyl isomerase [Rhodovulum sulfidophilum]
MSFALRPLAVLALGATLALPALADEIGPDTVVARVGDQEITIGHMIVLRAQLPAEYQQLPDDVLYQAVLDQLIRQTAVGEAIGKELSTGARLALENERRSFVAGEALSRLAEAAVTDEAVEAAYNATYGEADPTNEYHAAHILVETEDEAQAIEAQLRDGADFAQLAKEKSTGPSGPNGGDLGWFSEGMMVKPFEEAVTVLEPGEVSAPVQTQFGWHVIKLYETRLKDAPRLADVRGELVQQIQRDAMEEALEKYTEEADVSRPEIEVDPAILKDQSVLDR